MGVSDKYMSNVQVQEPYFNLSINALICFCSNASQISQCISNIYRDKNKEKPMYLAGDFNLLHLNWENNTLISGML